MNTPNILNVKCEKVRFRPGDKVLVRCLEPLNKEKRERLFRTVQRWAGPDVGVLVIDLTQVEIEIERDN